MSNRNEVPFRPMDERQRVILIKWLNDMVPNLRLPLEASEQELRACLIDGSVFRSILRRLSPKYVEEGGVWDTSLEPHSVKKFLAAMGEIGLHNYDSSDLEQGSMTKALECLWTLRAQFDPNTGEGTTLTGSDAKNQKRTRWKPSELEPLERNSGYLGEFSPRGGTLGEFSPRGGYLGEFSPLGGKTGAAKEVRKSMSESKIQRVLRSPIIAEPSSALLHHVGHKFHEVFQMKQGGYADIPADKISEMLKSNSLDIAPTQSLLSVVNGILEESIDRKNGEIPHRVACLLRKVVQEIERRISTQAEHIRTQNNLYKAREEKYQSRIRVLEALSTETSEETQFTMNKLQPLKSEKFKLEERKKADELAMMEERKKLEEQIIMEERKKLEAIMEQRKKLEEQSIVEERKKLEAIMEERKKLAEQGLMEEKKKLEEQAKMEERKKVEEQAKVEERMKGEVQAKMEEKNKVEEQAKIEERKKVEEQAKMEERKKLEQDVAKLLKERDSKDLEISELKQELELTRKTYERKKVEEQAKMEEKENVEQDVAKLLKEKNSKDLEISELKQELELTRKSYERKKVEEQAKMEEKEKVEQDVLKLLKEKDNKNLEISELKQELESTKKTYEQHCLKVETKAKEAQVEFEERFKELDLLLADSRKKEKEIEASAQSKAQSWRKKELTYQNFVDFQYKTLQELKVASETIKHEVVKSHESYSGELSRLGEKLRGLADSIRNYHKVLAENRKLYNEVQDLKGNIRVYCRIRPFIQGESRKQTTIDYIGENGEVAVANPSKQGKESRKMFKFNKVFGPASTQEEVYLDTQPLIRSVLDGYNVCIFAYGQTGSGKTYTMSGPSILTKEEWGVNYRALNDLFQICQGRKSIFLYEVGVQMVEIYNEQVLDLLSSGSQKKLGIRTGSQPDGLAVPDASMHPVQSTSDVMELMEIGLANRAVSATAMNQRSSRSHSVLTVHINGSELETGSGLRGNLHLVDLAGSERVDRSAVTGDRLKEAQHINKSLSALGDVIFALAQKSAHVPYRNSKLTQVLQTSLGGQAKTLMFVQLNPDPNSYSETLSTLKFAERVSGVELGAARSNKEGRDVRELMEQVTSLKDTIGKKDEEIERLQLIKGNSSSLRTRSPSPSKHTSRQLSKTSGVPDQDNCSEHSDKISEGDERDADSEGRLSDASDGGPSTGTDADSSVRNVVDLLEKQKPPSKVPRPPLKQTKTTPTTTTVPRSSTLSRDSKLSTGLRKTPGSLPAVKTPKKL